MILDQFNPGRCELVLVEGRYGVHHCDPKVELTHFYLFETSPSQKEEPTIKIDKILPQVNGLEAMVERLNVSNDLSGFMVTLRFNALKSGIISSFPVSRKKFVTPTK